RHPPPPHPFPTRRSSDLTPAIPAASYDLTMRRTTAAPPKPVSQSAMTGIPTESFITRAARRCSVIVITPVSGIPKEAEIPKLERSEEHTSELQSPDHLVC